MLFVPLCFHFLLHIVKRYFPFFLYTKQQRRRRNYLYFNLFDKLNELNDKTENVDAERALAYLLSYLPKNQRKNSTLILHVLSSIPDDMLSINEDFSVSLFNEKLLASNIIDLLRGLHSNSERVHQHCSGLLSFIYFISIYTNLASTSMQSMKVRELVNKLRRKRK